MMTLHDAYTLAAIKLKTRKGRTIFSAFSVSIGITCILGFAFGTHGLVRLANAVFADKLYDRYFVVEVFSNPTVSVEEEEGGQGGEGEERVMPEEALSVEKYREKHSNMINAFHHVQGTETALLRADVGETPTALQTRSGSIGYIDPVFAEEFLSSGTTFSAEVDGKIPALLDEGMLLPENVQFAFFGDRAKERYEGVKQGREAVIGRSFELFDESTEPATPTGKHVVVVGVISQSLLFHNAFVNGTIVLPTWSLQNESLNEGAIQRMIGEFATKEERDEYVKANDAGGMFNGGVGVLEIPHSFVSAAETPRQQIDSMAKFLRSVSYGVGGFFLVISALIVMTTLGKIVADSKKEIAVFRAVGAHKKDIRKIYYEYVVLLVSLAFGIGTVCAGALTVLASTRWGDQIFYSVVSFSQGALVSKPAFLFFSFDFFAWIALYGFVICIGIIASFLPIRRASKVEPIQVLREL